MKRKNNNISKEEYLRIIKRLHSIELEETETKKELIPLLKKEATTYIEPIQVFILQLNRLNNIIDRQIHFEKKKLISSIHIPIYSYQEINQNIDNLLTSFLLPNKNHIETNIYLPNTISCFLSSTSLNNFLQAIQPLIDKKRTILNWIKWLKILELEKQALLEKKKYYENTQRKKHPKTLKIKKP